MSKWKWEDEMGSWKGDWRNETYYYHKDRNMTPNMVALAIVVLACIVTFIAVAHIGTLLLSYMDIYADF